ncbi:MAG: sugar kinase [Acidobacteria bacterium]|nr:sugar kinase [Acidobacteriota bacterium]
MAAPSGLFVGLSTLDLVWRVRGYPRVNSKNVVSERAVFAGGPSANAAVVFAALGGAARLRTPIGCHPLAAMVRQELEGQGVEVLDAAPEFEGLPPMASILVSDPGGDRTVVSTAASGLPDVGFAEADFDPPTDVLLIDGHLLRAGAEAARGARRRGIPSAIDAGSWKDGLDEALATVDFVVCSEDFFPPGIADHDALLRDLARRGAPHRAVTRGGSSILWETAGAGGETPVERIEAVDTLGAGDFFHGAFAYAVALGKAFPDALAFAADVATQSCREFGTRSWLAGLRG